MGIIRFILLDVLPLLIDLIVPAISVVYGLTIGNAMIVVMGCTYFYAVWINLLFGENHDR